MDWATFDVTVATVGGALLALGIVATQLDQTAWVRQELGEAVAANTLGEFLMAVLGSVLSTMPGVGWQPGPAAAGALGLAITVGSFCYIFHALPTEAGPRLLTKNVSFRYAKWQAWGYFISASVYVLLLVGALAGIHALAAAVLVWLLFSGTFEAVAVVLLDMPRRRREAEPKGHAHSALEAGVCSVGSSPEKPEGRCWSTTRSGGGPGVDGAVGDGGGVPGANEAPPTEEAGESNQPTA